MPIGRRDLLTLLGLGALRASLGCGRGEVLAIYNWGDYLAPGLLDRFAERERAAGHGEVRPVQDFFLAELELLAKLRAGDQHDLVVPIDYLMTRMVRESLLLPLDEAALPGLANLDPAYPPWRPGAEDREAAGDRIYGVPYFWGVTGIGYDSDKIDPPPTSWEALFDPRYAGRISVLESKGDVFDALVLLAEIYDEPGLLDATIQEFLPDVDHLIRRIEDAVSEEDAQALVLAAHTLRSHSLTLGGAALSELAYGLERRGLAGSFGEDLGERITELHVARGDFFAALAAARPTALPPPGP
ncbi:MAG: extracellular solute-binding protein [Myxococcales bacterium]|nr:extracellular solute-binding protein [Myxococcales bacterium]